MSVRQVSALHSTQREHRDAILNASRQQRETLVHFIGELRAAVPAVSAILDRIIVMSAPPLEDDEGGELVRRAREALDTLHATVTDLLGQTVAALQAPVAPLEECILGQSGFEVSLRTATDDMLGLPAVEEISAEALADVRRISRQLAPLSRGDRHATEADEANDMLRIGRARGKRQAMITHTTGGTEVYGIEISKASHKPPEEAA